jgi:hypothetical protein
LLLGFAIPLVNLRGFEGQPGLRGQGLMKHLLFIVFLPCEPSAVSYKQQ